MKTKRKGFENSFSWRFEESLNRLFYQFRFHSPFHFSIMRIGRPHGKEGFVIPTKSFVKIGITKKFLLQQQNI